MTSINDKISARRFFARVFISNSGVSSRRVLAFMFSIMLIFLVFFKYDLEYCRLIALLIAGLLSLTTISSYINPQKPDDNSKE